MVKLSGKSVTPLYLKSFSPKNTSFLSLSLNLSPSENFKEFFRLGVNGHYYFSINQKPYKEKYIMVHPTWSFFQIKTGKCIAQKGQDLKNN